MFIVVNIRSNTLYHLLCFFSTINKQQFEALIADKDVVGKYMQDHAKLDSEDAAKADMLKKIKKGEPAMHGTTVRIIITYYLLFVLYNMLIDCTRCPRSHIYKVLT